MKRSSRAYVTSAVLVAMSTFSAQASPVWVRAQAGIGSYEMEDLNEEIRGLNALIYPLSMEEMNDGGFVGAELGLHSGTSRFEGGIQYAYLMGSRSVSDASGRIEYNVPAHLIAARLYFDVMPQSPGPIDVYVGVGGGFIAAAGDVQVSITGEGAATGSFEGTGPALDLALSLDWWVSPVLAVSPQFGARYAVVSGVEVDGQPVYAADGSDYSLDYSGVFVSVGLKLGKQPLSTVP